MAFLMCSKVKSFFKGKTIKEIRDTGRVVTMELVNTSGKKTEFLFLPRDMKLRQSLRSQETAACGDTGLGWNWGAEVTSSANSRCPPPSTLHSGCSFKKHSAQT